MENATVALVHDWLTGQRGGEKVLEVFAEIFPDAPIYTLFHFPGSQIEDIGRHIIRTSFLQKMPFMKKKYRWYLPLFPLAVELLDFQDFDLILSSSHCVAKGAIPSPDALHISYIHSPVRYAWNQYFAYFSPDKLGIFSRRLVPPMIHRRCLKRSPRKRTSCPGCQFQEPGEYHPRCSNFAGTNWHQ